MDADIRTVKLFAGDPTQFIIWVNMLPSIILSVHAVLKTLRDFPNNFLCDGFFTVQMML